MMLSAIAALAFAGQGLAASTTKIDITPDVALPLGGYTERGDRLSVAGGDRLYSRTVLFRSANTKIAVVSVETLTIPESLVREVKVRIPRDVFLFLAATHTHSAPDSQMLNDRMTFAIPGIASYKPEWLKWYADKIADGINAALKEKQPVYAVFANEGHTDFNIGRRKFADPDKTVTEVEAIEDPNAYSTFIRTRNLRQGGGQAKIVLPLDPLILQYAAHGTVYGAKNMVLRGDWPGVAAKTFGCEVLQGPIGDVLPKDWGPTPESSIRKIVQGLAAALSQQVDVWESGQPIGIASVPIELDPAKPHPTMAKSYGVPEAFAAGIVKQFAPPSASIVAFRVGKLAIVGIPGEPTSILGRQIRDAGRRMGFECVLVCSHVNGWMGYILDPGDYDRGGYEATLSFYGREEGSKVVHAGVAALMKLAKGKP